MVKDDDSAQPLKRRRGRPKGSKDRTKRSRRSNTVFDFKLGGHNLTDLAAFGRELDLVGILRLIQVQIGLKMLEELDSPDNKRLASLCEAAFTLHRMEMATAMTQAKTDLVKTIVADTDDAKADRVKTEDKVVFDLGAFRRRAGPE